MSVFSCRCWAASERLILAHGLTRSPPAAPDQRLKSVGHLDVDLERRNGLAAVELDRDLVRIELDMPRHDGKNLLAQRHQQIRLTEQAALVRQQDLQPFPGDGCGCTAAAEQPQQIDAHAALRPSNRFMKPLRSAGTTIWICSPLKRRAASK